MKKIITLSVLLIFFNITAQESNSYRLNSNKVNQFLDEVYYNCPDNVSNNIEKNISILNRVEIVMSNKTESELEKYPLFSNVELKNKCNKALTHDYLNFNPDNFNPLKYFFHFSSNEDIYYRVDKTNYLIKIIAYR